MKPRRTRGGSENDLRNELSGPNNPLLREIWKKSELNRNMKIFEVVAPRSGALLVGVGVQITSDTNSAARKTRRLAK